MIAHITQSGLQGEVLIPSSKSHTIRALLVAALAKGESFVWNPLDSQDARSCIRTIQTFGAKVEEISSDQADFLPAGRAGGAVPTGPDAATGPTSPALRGLKITGVGDNPQGILFSAPADVIDVGNSGTTEYLAAGIAALSPGYTVFTGDAQIRNRPVENLLAALRDLGAEAYTTRNNGKAPFVVRGPLTGGQTSIECPTSQYLSSLMLALPLAKGKSVVNVPLLYEQPYAEMTATWMTEQGIQFTNDNWKKLSIPGGQSYRSFTKQVPGDFSSAAFFAAAAAITGSSLLLRGLDMADSQGDKAIFRYLSAMGCRVDYLRGSALVAQASGASGEDDEENRQAYEQACHEGTDSIRIMGPSRAGRPLRGGRFDLNATPDALPALAVVACFAVGTVALYNVAQARLKETDRITVMRTELSKMGAEIEETNDGLVIQPRHRTLGDSALTGADVDGWDDHRVVMSLSVAGLMAEGSTRVHGAEAVSVTYPEFFDTLGNLATSGPKAVRLHSQD